MVDISQKILYETAVGEKLLFSLINATVSHEMRNPTNSIHGQVQEQQRLNMKYRNILDNLHHGNLRLSKRLLEKNLEKHEESTGLQISGTKILNFLINDMLDYA